MRVMAENPMGRQRSGWRYKLYRAGRGIRRNWGLYLLLLPAVVLLFCFNYNRVLEGMGLIVLHSGHASKIFRKLCGTDTWKLKWREDGEKEILWVVDPSHPIVDGLDEKIIIPHEEMYGERFDIPQPDEQVFISWFEGGEVFRSGCCWHRGKGKIFYFRPGHEVFPIYHQPEIQKVIVNAVKWAAPIRFPNTTFGNPAPIMPVKGEMEHSVQGLHDQKSIS